MVKIELSDETQESLRSLGERAAQIARRLSIEYATPISQPCQFVGHSVATRLVREHESARRAKLIGFDWLHFAMAIDQMHRDRGKND